MGLWVVNLTADVVVVADSEREAHEAANMGFDELSFADFGTFAVREVKTADDMPDGWDLDDKPLGDSRACYRHLVDEGDA